MQIQKGLVQVLLQGHGDSHGVLSFAPFILHDFCTWWKKAWPLHWFCIFKRRQELLGQHTEEAAHTLESHICQVQTEAQREVGVGGPQVQVDLGVDTASTSGEKF